MSDTADAKPAKLTIADALTEALRLHGQAAMQAEGATTSTDPRISGSKSGSAALAFRGGLPPSVEMERSMRHWADCWTASLKAANPAEARKAKTRAILAEVGMDATAVAFIYGSTTEAVKKLRGRNSRDPDTGQLKRALYQERVDGKPSIRPPLTAPPSTVIGRMEAKQVEEDEPADFGG